MNLLDHSLYKENIPFLILLVYLLNIKYKSLGSVFNGTIYAVAGFIPIFTALYVKGFNPFTYLQYSWRTWTTPVQYALFILVTYLIAYRRTGDTPYSVTLGLHLASASGYLYEVPRYINLQGIGWVIRFNKYSPFIVTYSIIALFVIIALFYQKEYKTTHRTLYTLSAYLLYSAWYSVNLDSVYALKRKYIWIMGHDIPWISIFKLPTMLFLVALTWGLPKREGINIYTLNNYTNRSCLHGK